jgi:electron transfer flavoprotein alpha/beta subunit
MPTMTAELTDGTQITGVEEVVEGSNGVHLKKEVDRGKVERVAYIPYSQLVYVSSG